MDFIQDIYTSIAPFLFFFGFFFSFYLTLDLLFSDAHENQTENGSKTGFTFQLGDQVPDVLMYGTDPKESPINHMNSGEESDTAQSVQHGFLDEIKSDLLKVKQKISDLYSSFRNNDPWYLELFLLGLMSFCSYKVLVHLYHLPEKMISFIGQSQITVNQYEQYVLGYFVCFVFLTLNLHLFAYNFNRLVLEKWKINFSNYVDLIYYPAMSVFVGTLAISFVTPAKIQIEVVKFEVALLTVFLGLKVLKNTISTNKATFENAANYHPENSDFFYKSFFWAMIYKSSNHNKFRKIIILLASYFLLVISILILFNFN